MGILVISFEEVQLKDLQEGVRVVERMIVEPCLSVIRLDIRSSKAIHSLIIGEMLCCFTLLQGQAEAETALDGKVQRELNETPHHDETTSLSSAVLPSTGRILSCAI